MFIVADLVSLNFLFYFKKSLLDTLDCKLITRLSDMDMKISACSREHIPLHSDGIGFIINF